MYIRYVYTTKVSHSTCPSVSLDAERGSRGGDAMDMSEAVAQQSYARAMAKIQRQVRAELDEKMHHEIMVKEGYVKKEEVYQVMETRVEAAIAEAREQERQTAQSTKEAEIARLTAEFNAELQAVQAAAERAATEAAQASGVEDQLAESLARERELAEKLRAERTQAMRRQGQAVEAAVAKERAKGSMTSVVRMPCSVAVLCYCAVHVRAALHISSAQLERQA